MIINSKNLPPAPLVGGQLPGAPQVTGSAEKFNQFVLKNDLHQSRAQTTSIARVI